MQPEGGALFRCRSQTQSQGQRCIGQGTVHLVVIEPGQSLEESQHLPLDGRRPGMEREVFQGYEQARAAQPIAALRVVPDAPLMQDGFQAIFIAGNGCLAIARTPQRQP